MTTYVYIYIYSEQYLNVNKVSKVGMYLLMTINIILLTFIEEVK